MTGVATPVSTDLPAGLFNVTEAALDNAGRRYFISNVLSPETPTNHLLMIDLGSGAVTSFDLIINGIVFDRTTVKNVSIDIKPDSFPNRINPKSKALIQVAILTTDTFDTSSVDPLSVKFGPKGAGSQGQAHIEDIDVDGDLDLMLRFETQDTGISCGDISASLTGKTFGGLTFRGSDSIVTVGCNNQ